MTFLPILERELRVRARNRTNYWARFGLGAVAMLMALPPLAWSGPFANPSSVGRSVFEAVISAGFVLSCASCLLTSQSIGTERRDGTLGLLLLTRVRIFDVLLGKFASSGLSALFGLVAFLPVLMIPVLAGGVTGGEAFRKGIVLLDCLFLALSAGLWVSAREKARYRTAWLAFLLIVVLVLVPHLLARFSSWVFLELASPLGTLRAAGDNEYKANPGRYWFSLGVVQLVAWLLLCGAALKMRGQDASGTAIPGPRYRRAVSRAERKPSDLDREPTPLHWLLRRQRGLRAMLWVAAGLGCLVSLIELFLGRLAGLGGFFAGSWVLGFAMSAITGAIFAWVASRFFVEARRTGELEILLTTPLGAQAIVSVQWDVLKRLIRWPVLVSLAPILTQVLLFWRLPFVGSQSGWWLLVYGLSLLSAAVLTVFAAGALCWLGIWFGLRLAGQARAIFWAVCLARGAPLALSLIWWIFINLSVRAIGAAPSPFFMVFASLMPQTIHLLLFIGLIGLARSQLRKDLSAIEPLTPSYIASQISAVARSVIGVARTWPSAG